MNYKFKKLRIHIRHYWYFLWIRKNEFHKSLDLDLDYMSILTEAEIQDYLKLLTKRRNIANIRDLHD